VEAIGSGFGDIEAGRNFKGTKKNTEQIISSVRFSFLSLDC
jgi:hypothetical protein